MTKKRKAEQRLCLYWQMWNYYNHGGAQPCQVCPACKQQAASDARLKQWNIDTANGADSKR